jgi:hypothetical protein
MGITMGAGVKFRVGLEAVGLAKWITTPPPRQRNRSP